MTCTLPTREEVLAGIGFKLGDGLTDRIEVYEAENNMPAHTPDPDYVRNLGKLEGIVEGIHKSLSDISDSIEVVRRDSDESRRRLYDRMEKKEQETAFKFQESEREHQKVLRAVTDTLQSVTKQLEKSDTAIAGLTEMVQGHGRALVDHEKRLDDHLEAHRIEGIRQKTNRRWIKGILSTFMAFEADHMSGWKLVKYVFGMFGGK